MKVRPGFEALAPFFRIIEEGNWGSRGGVLSFLDLLDHGASVFTPERAAAIRTALITKYDR